MERYLIDKLPTIVDMGYVGEKAFRGMEIDMTTWMEETPDGIPSIVYIRPGDSADDAYIVATTFEDNILTWIYSDSDLGSQDGTGFAQVWLEKEANSSIVKRGKSAGFSTHVKFSVGSASETVPAAQTGWMEQMTALKVATVNAKTAADDAKTAAQAAKTAAEAAQTGAEGAAEHFEDFFDVNDFNSDPDGKVNVLSVPYSMEEFLFGKTIYADGTINDQTTKTVSPLIPVVEGTYGLKTAHDANGIGQISSGNSYKNGYGFFAADGETVVSRPDTLLHNISGDIYVFDVPEGAAYVRFGFASGANSGYHTTAAYYFNQWILLPGADDSIDNSFFTLAVQKPNGVVHKIVRNDGSHLELIDEKNRGNVAVDWTEHSSEAFAIGDYIRKDGVLYRFTSAHTAGSAWSDTEVTRSSLAAEIKSLKSSVDGKANKVTSPTNNNFVAFDAYGNLKDSGHSHDDYLPAGSTSGAEGWLARNDLDSDMTGKHNVLRTPYSLNEFLTDKIIYADGTINDSTNSSVSPLIPVTAGTYGLKVAHDSNGWGQIKSGNNYKNGYGFFNADGHTIVARPTNLLHNITGDIYVFEVPSDAKFVRFSFAGAGAYAERGCNYFNQWILLPDADDTITNDFFALATEKGNGNIDKLKRLDGSYLSVIDSRFGAKTRMEFGAHNGAEYYAPECTVPAYRIAGQQRWGYAWVAGIDFSTDGTMYVIHDDTVDRTTDGTGYLNQMSDTEIAALNIDETGEGYDLADFDASELKIPTFEQVLQQCVKYGMKMVLRLHAFPNEYTSASAIATWDALVNLLKAYNVQTKDIVCYIGTSAMATICRSLFGNDVEIATFLGQSATAQDFVDWFTNYSITGNRAAIIYCERLDLTAVKLLHSNGIRVFAYGSRSEDDAAAFALWGVDVFQNSKLYMLPEGK